MTERLYRNIWRIHVPLPDSPLGGLNCYVVRDEGAGRHLIIDTGFNRPECRQALLGGLEELGIEPAHSDVFLTHVHSDHTGNAAALQKLGAVLHMSAPDYRDTHSIDWEKRARWYIGEGMPEEVCRTVMANNPAVLFRPDFFTALPVRDGDELVRGGLRLRCLHTPGHSHGHMCLYEAREKLLFSGDHILFDITPNICSMGPDTDMLSQYLDSLNRVRALEIAHCFPAHRTTGQLSAAERIDALLAHHEARLRETEELVRARPGQTAYEIAGQMRWSIRARDWEHFPPGQKWFAMGEAMAHLDRLRTEGRVLCERRGPVRVYRAAGPDRP